MKLTPAGLRRTLSPDTRRSEIRPLTRKHETQISQHTLPRTLLLGVTCPLSRLAVDARNTQDGGREEADVAVDQARQFLKQVRRAAIHHRRPLEMSGSMYANVALPLSNRPRLWLDRRIPGHGRISQSNY